MLARDIIGKVKNDPQLLLRLDNYVAADGSVSSYVLDLHRSYRDLVISSLELVKERQIEKPEHIDAQVWTQALQELQASWEKYLEHGPSRDPAQGIAVDKYGVHYLPDMGTGDDHIVLLGPYKIIREIHVPPTKITVSKAKTVAKDYITEKCPIGGFLFRLNLYPNKYDRVDFFTRPA